MSPFIRIFHKSKTTSIYYLLNARHLHLLSHLNSPGKFDILSVWLIGKLWLRGKDFLSSNSWKETKASLYLFTMQCPFSNVHYCWLKKWELRQTFMILPQFRFLALSFLSYFISCPLPPPLSASSFTASHAPWYTDHVFLRRLFPLLVLYPALYISFHHSFRYWFRSYPCQDSFPISPVSFPLFLKNFNSIANTRKALMYHN